MKSHIFVIPLIIFSLALISCGQNGPFIPVSNLEDAVNITVSATPGRVINPEREDSIGISLSYDESRVLPEKLEVSLLDKNDAVIGSPVVFEGKELTEILPPVDTTSLKDGFYKLKLTVYGSDGQVLKETVTPFFESRIPIQIEGIEVYPPEFTPGSSGFIIPKVDAPGTVWVRWSLGNSILSEGTLDQYAAGFVWKAPESEGAYTIKMEVFPFAPPDLSTSYSFSSQLYREVQVFVTNSVSPDIYDLSPGSSYTVLLNLNGSLKNEGIQDIKAIPIGDPVLQLENGGFGYRLSDDSGIKLSGSTILPFSEGVLAPFSATMRLSVRQIQREKNFLTVSDSAGELFSIKTDSSGEIIARLKQPSGNLECLSGIVPEGLSEITLSVVPLQSGITFLWYKDGELIQSRRFDYIPLAVTDTASGTAVISGENGFSGFLDYAGIFFQDREKRSDIDDGIYKRAVIRHGESESTDLIEGFDGLYIPRSIKDLNINNKSITIGGGNLIIKPGGTVTILTAESDVAGIDINVQVPEGQNKAVFFFSVLREGNNVKTVEIPFSPNRTVSSVEGTFNGETLTLSGSSKKEARINLKEGDKLEYGIHNLSDTKQLKIAAVRADERGKTVVENKIRTGKSSL